MKSVSFLCGALVGAAAVIWSAKRSGLKIGGNGNGGIMKLAGLSMSSSGKESGQQASSNGSSSASSESKVYPSFTSPSDASHSKEYNVKQITDFIKGNADVRREVEQILKETNSIIPGL